MTQTTTQFVWRQCLQMPPFDPPEPKGKRGKYGPDPMCWLCAGLTDGRGWHIKDVIGAAFTDTAIARAPTSSTVCDCCAALMKKEAWQQACEAHGHSPYFPTKDDKEPFLANWMFSSHVFSETQGWQRPDRAQARAILLDPPPGRWVITLAEVGKKHVIFRAPVNADRDRFIVQMDEDALLIRRDAFAQCLADFERGYGAGFSKDSMLTGQYNQAAVLAVGLSVWRSIEEKLSHWRRQHPSELRLCHFCGQKPPEDERVAPAPKPAPAPLPKKSAAPRAATDPAETQFALF